MCFETAPHTADSSRLLVMAGTPLRLGVVRSRATVDDTTRRVGQQSLGAVTATCGDLIAILLLRRTALAFSDG